jgi:hypothetical protein
MEMVLFLDIPFDGSSWSRAVHSRISFLRFLGIYDPRRRTDGTKARLTLHRREAVGPIERHCRFVRPRPLTRPLGHPRDQRRL